MQIDDTKDACLRIEFERLRRGGKQATDEGRLDDALDLYDVCAAHAQALGDQDLVDLTFGNRCAVLIALGRHDGQIRGLREILSRSTDRLNRLVAAYHVARIYELRQETKKGLLYTRIARVEYEKRGIPDPYWEANLHNQMGSFLLLGSRFEEAAAEYRHALEADPGAAQVRRAVASHNLGYCSLMLGDHRLGLALLYRSLRFYCRSEVLEYRMQAHLDLCYGLLEIGRNASARRHAERALRLAERLASAAGLKNALYLLGEAEHLLGDDQRARQCFDRLQHLFPDTPYLTEMLMAVDIRQMINLRA